MVGLASLTAARLGAEAQALGFTVTIVAKYQAQMQRPTSLIILNLDCREPDGLDTLVTFRKHVPEAQIVGITSASPLPRIIRAVRSGATTVLAQPTTLNQVLAALLQGTQSLHVSQTSFMSLDRAIWEHLNQVVDEAGSISEAARRLRLDRTSLKRMLRKVPPIS
jgi:two-component system response regulator RegA